MSEFTVILFAGGSSRLSSDLSLPKGLLPVGNRPLIWYSLQLIQSHPSLSSSPLLILVSPSSRQLFDEYLSTLSLSYELLVSRPPRDSTSDDPQPLSEHSGTLDVLRSCAGRIRTESICLLSCDLFGRMNLTPLINTFRVRDATLIMLLLPTPYSTKDSLVQPGQKAKFTPEVEFYTVDPSSETVTSVQLRADLEEHLTLRQNVLAKYPRMRIRSDLVDSHLYLIKKSSLDIALRSKCSSFRKEFLPKMIRQLAIGQSLEDLLPSAARQQKLQRQTTADFDDHGDLSEILSEYLCENKQIHGGCYYSLGERQLFRVKHVLSYLEANRQAASLSKEEINSKDRGDQVKISGDCLIGEGCDIGKKSSIKRTIIGKNCRIEEKCQLTNCVLLDHVHLREGVTIQNSILSSRSTVGTKCEIHNSIVCANQQLEPNKKFNGETIAADGENQDGFMLYDDDEQ